MIDDELKKKIKNALDISEIIGRFVTLNKKGRHFVGICPFHGDSHPSLLVIPEKQTYKCYACGAGGDIFQFIMEIEKMSYPEAVRYCANLAGIPFEDKEATPEDIARAKEKESLRIAIKAAGMYYEKHLPEAEMFLVHRGYTLDCETVKEFHIGYAPAGNKLIKDLTASGYEKKYLETVNVVATTERGTSYDVFQDRVMFPFMDLNGNITGYSGRIVTPNKNVGKYVNTGNTPLFTKGVFIFGLYQAKKHISDKNRAYLVEGQFDVTSMHKAGVKNTIAGSGTAFTPDQLRLLMRFTSNVTVMYDSDAAGAKAAYKQCEAFLRAGMIVDCIALPDGQDPDNLATELKDKTAMWLVKNTVDFVEFFFNAYKVDLDNTAQSEQAFTSICSLVAVIKDDFERNQYISKVALKFHRGDVSITKKKVRTLRLKNDGKDEDQEVMKPGIYGIDELKDYIKSNRDKVTPFITADYQEYLDKFYEEPVIFIKGKPSRSDIQSLRAVCTEFTTESYNLNLRDNYAESDYLSSIAEIYKAGITDITVNCVDEDGEDREEQVYLLDYYIDIHAIVIFKNTIERPALIERCAEMISYAPDTVRNVNSKAYAGKLKLNNKQYNDVLKPYLDKRKSRVAINSQREDNEEYYDPDVVPSYVEENPDYKEMYNNYGYYPRINSAKEPVGYMFRSDKGGHTLVADFYMEPLLHIKDPDKENNKRVFKIYRRYYPKPIFLSIKSTALLKKSTLEEVLILEEALNFDNGEEKHWSKIKSCMSRKYTTCREIKIYGQQSEDFFAFANGIFHFKDGVPVFEESTELGIVTHNNENYYLPAYSTIYANSPKDDDQYEALRYFVFKDIPLSKQCSFEKWTYLMDDVYKANDNGKWAIIYAVMCAFRSDIHSIDRLFTAPFFMGPTSSGKTQIAISIRSLFIAPDMPAFNLNTGSDAAFSTLMGAYRDVPVVLEEYNNKQISDVKFQALKAITYDGDGRQKRKATSGKEIEIDKVFTPVAISGQETPQRDDNALMNRIIVCEVPKKESWTDEEKAVFDTLKGYEKTGLSNILFEILKLRPVIREHFKAMQRCIAKELSQRVQNGNSSGDMTRLINTASLFITTVKIIEDYAQNLKLPFTYKEFFEIAAKKIIFQVELITHTDKLAEFFKAMDIMISTDVIQPGRDFCVEEPAKGRLTIKEAGGEKKEIDLPTGCKVLFLRLSPIFALYSKSGLNKEDCSQSTLEQNLRSNPSYIGFVPSKRFTYERTIEVSRATRDDKESNNAAIETTGTDETMVRIRKKESPISSCIALNYDQFRRFYDVDLERSSDDGKPGDVAVTANGEQPLPF